MDQKKDIANTSLVNSYLYHILDLLFRFFPLFSSLLGNSSGRPVNKQYKVFGNNSLLTNSSVNGYCHCLELNL